jgi:hypothetical protein
MLRLALGDHGIKYAVFWQILKIFSIHSVCFAAAFLLQHLEVH